MATAVVQQPCETTFHALSKARRGVLMVDYDGTLAPFTADREHARPYPEVRDMIEAIMALTNTEVVIISGRHADEVVDLLQICPNPEVWGCHGLEYITRHGTRYRIQIPASTAQELTDVSAALDDEGLEEMIEIKHGIIAVHWRDLPFNIAREVELTARRVFSAVSRSAELVVRSFDGGVELRSVLATKAAAVRSVMARHGDRIPAAYLGDDWTDEDAFQVMKGLGLPILVRQQYRPTCADVWLSPPEQLHEFLTRWLCACGGAA